MIHMRFYSFIHKSLVLFSVFRLFISFFLFFFYEKQLLPKFSIHSTTNNKTIRGDCFAKQFSAFHFFLRKKVYYHYLQLCSYIYIIHVYTVRLQRWAKKRVRSIDKEPLSISLIKFLCERWMEQIISFDETYFGKFLGNEEHEKRVYA